MELFKIGRDIPFMRHAKIFNAISFITFALAVFFLFTRGLHLSVEFTGGTLMEVSYSQPANLEKVRGTVASLGYAEVQVQNFGTARDVMIRLPAQKGVSTAQQSEKVMAALKADAGFAKLSGTWGYGEADTGEGDWSMDQVERVGAAPTGDVPAGDAPAGDAAAGDGPPAGDPPAEKPKKGK
jgi:preprotein translocase subunit SecF